jgi:hypothetical protein
MKELYRAIEHRIHFWRHRDLHASHCTCKGTGKWPRPPAPTKPAAEWPEERLRHDRDHHQVHGLRRANWRAVRALLPAGLPGVRGEGRPGTARRARLPWAGRVRP